MPERCHENVLLSRTWHGGASARSGLCDTGALVVRHPTSIAENVEAHASRAIYLGANGIRARIRQIDRTLIAARLSPEGLRQLETEKAVLNLALEGGAPALAKRVQDLERLLLTGRPGSEGYARATLERDVGKALHRTYAALSVRAD